MKMNIEKLRNELTDIVGEKFKQQYPEIFVKPTTSNIDDYENAYEGYNLYIKYINSISQLTYMPKYKISSLNFYNGNDEHKKLLNDIKNTNDILKFVFLHFPLT